MMIGVNIVAIPVLLINSVRNTHIVAIISTIANKLRCDKLDMYSHINDITP